MNFTMAQTLKITTSHKDHWPNVSILKVKKKKEKQYLRERESRELALIVNVIRGIEIHLVYLLCILGFPKYPILSWNLSI